MIDRRTMPKIDHKHHYHLHHCTHCGKIQSNSHLAKKKDQYTGRLPSVYADETARNLEKVEDWSDERKSWNI